MRPRLLELKAGELAIRRAHLVADCEANELREHLLSLRAAGAWDIELARAIGYPWDEDSDVDVIEQQVDAHRRYAYRSQLEDVVRRHWRQIGDASTQVVRRLSDEH